MKGCEFHYRNIEPSLYTPQTYVAYRENPRYLLFPMLQYFNECFFFRRMLGVFDVGFMRYSALTSRTLFGDMII